MIAVTNWTPNEALYFVVVAVIAMRYADTVGCFIDDRLQRWWQRYVQRRDEKDIDPDNDHFT